MIKDFYTTLISYSRQVWTDDVSATTEQSSFYGHIQQANPDFVNAIGLDWGTVFIIFCDIATAVKIGDQLTVATGDYSGTYHITDRQVNSIGVNPHTQLIVTKIKTP